MRYIVEFKPNEKIVEINMVTLTKSELTNGRKSLINSGANTYVADKHAWISEVNEGVTVSARGFSNNLPIEENLPIVNAIYIYNNPHIGGIILLEMNYYIYMRDKKIDSIACPNHMRIN